LANIVVCADGTWNRPEEDVEKDQATNVLKLARAIRPDPPDRRQHVFYDWGLGSYHDRVVAGATGRGIHKNIVDGYRYIVQNYTPDDRIYLFGFSRGAYTVRALCGLINNCGIVRRPHARRIEEAWRTYKRTSSPYHPDGEKAVAFRTEYSHESRRVEFIGVWDTVGALGIPFSVLGFLDGKDEFYDTKMGPNVRVARHALAIDERRADFEPTLWRPRDGVDLKQVWFSGVHGDVGGGCGPGRKTGTTVSDVALAWMLDEAAGAGLALEPHVRDRLTDGATAPLNRSRRHIYRARRALHRPLSHPEIPTRIHPSVRRRWEADPGYRPRELKKLVDRGWDTVDVGA
jgi:uncharacterized protein (DUF2235 family)